MPGDAFDIVIVGAGLSGAVIAERCANDLNMRCLVVEKRGHVGGNCYDYIDEETGIRVGKYGAHIFHTNIERVWLYVQRFCTWTPYVHRVRACVDGITGTVPLPVCRETINRLFDVNLTSAQDMRAWIDAHKTAYVRRLCGSDDGDEHNGEEEVCSKMGPQLHELLFKHYTKKQWGKYPCELDGSVLRRIPLRLDDVDDDRYFTDTWQALPANGYAAMFDRMLRHDNITVRLNTDWFDVAATLLRSQCRRVPVFYTGPIDRYFAGQSPELPMLEYRSIDFHRAVVDAPHFQEVAVVNHPSPSVPFTRIVEYKHFPNQPPGVAQTHRTVIVSETTTDDGEPHYPVPSARNRALYDRYKQMADDVAADASCEHRTVFVGRLATYKYLNMDEAILAALNAFDRFRQATRVART